MADQQTDTSSAPSGPAAKWDSRQDLIERLDECAHLVCGNQELTAEHRSVLGILMAETVGWLRYDRDCLG